VKRVLGIEQNTQDVARRSLVAVCAIAKGETFTEQNLTAKRPSGGRSAMEYWDMLGQIADKDYKENELI
jgi:sialic acid synthase SpsE